MIFDDSVKQNKTLLKSADIWDGIKSKIKAINYYAENCYGKDYIKMKFSSDENLPLNKPLKFHTVTIAFSSAFEKGGKLFP